MTPSSNFAGLSKKELLLRMEDAEETLRAIRSGEVDALVVMREDGDQIFTLKDAIRPYQVLIEEMNEGAVTLALDGMILYCNARFADILALPSQTLLGKSFFQFVSPADRPRARELLEQRPAGKGRGELSLLGAKVDVPVGISLTELRLDGELRLGVVISDITERKRAEETLQRKNEEIKTMSQQLWQATRLVTMGEMAASLAQEFNEPLATVNQQTEDLLAQFPADHPNSVALHAIGSQVERMWELVENLMIFNHRSYPVITPVNVREEINKALDLVQHELRIHQVAIVQEFAGRAAWVRADGQQLRQVFLNLFANAIDAMPEGGTLSIRISVDQEDGTKARSPGQRRTTGSLVFPTAPPPYAVIEITDTGRGIPADLLSKVWEPFFSTKTDGTGLGLGICQRIILEHGGRIELASDGKPGKGTRVKITLPGIEPAGA